MPAGIVTKIIDVTAPLLVTLAVQTYRRRKSTHHPKPPM
jgi:hypothetical protein